jgi:hypothetical protein
MSKKDIYATSYTVEPKAKNNVLEALQLRNEEKERLKKLGQLLKKEQEKNTVLQRKINRLEDDKRRFVAH